MLVRGIIECASDRFVVHENEVIEMDERLVAELQPQGIVEPIGAETGATVPPEQRTGLRRQRYRAPRPPQPKANIEKGALAGPNDDPGG